MPWVRPPQVLVKMRRVQKREGDPDDYLVLLLAGRYLRPKLKGKVYMLCEVERTFPGMFKLHDVLRPVKIVLKVYAKIPPKNLEAERERQQYQRLLKGQLTFTK